MKVYQVLPLPPKNNLETKEILKKVASAHRYLAELKGLAMSIPNEEILINTLSLQEAKDSSAVENIITTQDELYKAEIFTDYNKSPAAKEVYCYSQALKRGFFLIRDSKILTINNILEIHKKLEGNNAGFRKLPGTTLTNSRTKEIVYTPPQDFQKIVNLMSNLEKFINDDGLYDVDPLIKLAVIHFQFESIHPFYDGNGRTGRIINILYLILKDLLDIPVLYLSRYIILNKNEYYRLLQKVRDEDDWASWIIFMLNGIEATSKQTITLIKDIKNLMLGYKHRIREEFPKLYSQDLINSLFRHPYTKISFIQKSLGVSRLTAAKYLDMLTKAGFLEKHKIGVENYFINTPLMQLFSDIPVLPK